jgi:hypothetical protein
VQFASFRRVNLDASFFFFFFFVLRLRFGDGKQCHHGVQDGAVLLIRPDIVESLRIPAKRGDQQVRNLHSAAQAASIANASVPADSHQEGRKRRSRGRTLWRCAGTMPACPSESMRGPRHPTWWSETWPGTGPNSLPQQGWEGKGKGGGGGGERTTTKSKKKQKQKLTKISNNAKNLLFFLPFS